MKMQSYTLTLLLILSLSMTSGLLLYFYMDPESNLVIAFTTMGIASFLSIASIMSLLLYIFKRVSYRWLVDTSIYQSCVRQGFLFATGCIGLIIFHKAGILNYQTGLLLFFILGLFELMIESIGSETSI